MTSLTTVTLPYESTTEHLRTSDSETIGEIGHDGLFSYGLVIQSFPESLKNSYNEKPLKIGVTGVGKLKTRAEKERFPESIAKVLRVLNTPVKRSLENVTIVS